MIKRTTIALLFLLSVNAFAQTDSITRNDWEQLIAPLKETIHVLEAKNSNLKQELNLLNSNFELVNTQIDSLAQQTKANKNTIGEVAHELGLKISSTETEANQKISEVDKSLGKNTLYGIIGILLTALLSILFYWLVSKRQKGDRTDLIIQLSQTKSSIEESLVKEFGKQTELLETQVKLLEQNNREQKQSQKANNNEIDHSLALKVADEITLMERNISHMDGGTKGLKQLIRSITKLKDNLNANGYEIPELLGKPFNQGMKVIVASSVPDETLEKDAEIITKIIKPQVNYNEKMIQAAQIEVSVGY